MMSYTLEYSVTFLCEERTEMYEQCFEGVPQLKKVLGTKNAWQSWALPNLERCVV
jgi:hypothetical protein